jgi:hypothetical protein
MLLILGIDTFDRETTRTDGGIKGSRWELSKDANEEGRHIQDFLLPFMSEADQPLELHNSQHSHQLQQWLSS